jgi:hypothetical protein
MPIETWKEQLREVHARGTAAWRAGRRSPATMFESADLAVLGSIGCSAQELFDFIDDLQDYGEPDLETVLEAQAIRREYFMNVMGGQLSAHTASMNDLPAKSTAVDGIAWLPRLIVKARLKLRGEMPPDLMYGCGGDRPFLRRMNMTLPGFLKLVWDCGDDDRKIVDAVKHAAGSA